MASKTIDKQERPTTRNTIQRALVLEAVRSLHCHPTSADVYEAVREKHPNISRATVYRNLQALSRSGRLDVLVAGDGESLYRQCEDTGHHHHLVCRECGRTVEFLAPKLEASMTAIAQEHGFTEVDHTLEVFGLCTEHAAQSAAEDEGGTR